jgi:hypothetical protein
VVDLADPAARDAFLNEELAGASKALVLSEGLLTYLEDGDVVALSAAFKRPEVAWWMLDLSGPGLQKLRFHHGAPIRSVAAVDAVPGVAASARSAQPG